MCDKTNTSLSDRAAYLPAAIAVGMYIVVVLLTAWISDDAYITIRTVENFLDGHGLTWNTTERVQAYTHPLWMLLLTGMFKLSSHTYYMTILLCAVCSIGAVTFFAARVAAAPFPALIGVLVFTLSKAYTDYSTSGLENPLTHLLLMAFLFVYLTRESDRRTLLWLSLLTALLMLNRPDAILLVLPALAVAFYRARGLRALGMVAIGFIPLVAWELFALLYYGSPLPNPAYAKLNHSIPAADLIGRGLLYLLSTLRLDPLTIVIIIAGLVAPIVTGRRRNLPIALGGLLYLLYVVSIGGDFMLGRFLTAPLLIAVVLLTREKVSMQTGTLLLVLVLVAGIVPRRSPLLSNEDYGFLFRKPIDDTGIVDERAFYYHGTGLLRATSVDELPCDSRVSRGRALRRAGDSPVVLRAIGMEGYFAGPEIHIVDECALADPLLARLKPAINGKWRVGHLYRQPPPGYLETLRTGRNVIADPRLAEYYDKIRIITRGDLWDPQRLREIIRFNLGMYDDLLNPPTSSR